MTDQCPYCVSKQEYSLLVNMTDLTLGSNDLSGTLPKVGGWGRVTQKPKRGLGA